MQSTSLTASTSSTLLLVSRFPVTPCHFHPGHKHQRTCSFGSGVGYHVRLLLLALPPSWLPGWLPSPAAWDCKCASGFSLKLPSEIPELTLLCLNVRSLPNKTDNVPEVIRDWHENVFLSHCYKTDTTLSDTDLVVDLAVVL